VDYVTRQLSFSWENCLGACFGLSLIFGLPPKESRLRKINFFCMFFCLGMCVCLFIWLGFKKGLSFRLSYIFGPPAWRPPKAKGINLFGKNTGAAEEVGKKFCRPEY